MRTFTLFSLLLVAVVAGVNGENSSQRMKRVPVPLDGGRQATWKREAEPEPQFRHASW